MSSEHPTHAEQLLRGLAVADEHCLRSILTVSPGRIEATGPTPALPPATRTMIHLAGLLAAGGSTTSLHWAVELAARARVRDEEIVDVLATVAATLGSARVVAVAPRLALAIGYDIEVPGWDGD